MLGVFTQNYLRWIGGEGDAQIIAEGLLDLTREEVLYDLNAQGVVNLKDAKVNLETPFFAKPFQGTGKITINNQIVNVETLEGTFADKDLSVTGALPILTAVKDLENPLTVNLPQGKITINQLYKGMVEGKVKVTGTALRPVIGGKVRLEDGTVSIPKTEEKQEDAVQIIKNQVVIADNQSINTKSDSSQTNNKANNQTQSSFVTALNNFQVELENFSLRDRPLYDFDISGDLNLNGTIDTLDNIQPEGTIILNAADVDWLSSSFSLARNRQNTIVFTPEQGIFNPYVDIQLRTQISELDNLRLAESGANEISDPLSQGNNSGIITVFLVIDGEVKEILPNLSQKVVNCQIRPNDSPLVENSQIYTESELNRLTNCFNQVALTNRNELAILDSPVVKLNSIPNRSQGEIVNLFGQEFLSFAEQLANSSQAELIELGFTKFVLTPIFNQLFYRLDDEVVNAGKKVGLDYLRLYPNFEGIYEINPNSGIRSTYNYVFNEVKLEYELRF